MQQTSTLSDLWHHRRDISRQGFFHSARSALTGIAFSKRLHVVGGIQPAFLAAPTSPEHCQAQSMLPGWIDEGSLGHAWDSVRAVAARANLNGNGQHWREAVVLSAKPACQRFGGLGDCDSATTGLEDRTGEVRQPSCRNRIEGVVEKPLLVAGQPASMHADVFRYQSACSSVVVHS